MCKAPAVAPALALLCFVAVNLDASWRGVSALANFSDVKPELDTDQVRFIFPSHPRTRRQVQVCGSQQCQALQNQIKSNGGYSNIHTETSCVNNVCEDTMTVRFFDGSTKVYICNRNGCGQKGSASSQGQVVQTRPLQSNDDDIVCKNSPCQALVNQLQNNGGYSNLNMHTSCRNNQCDDTVTVAFFDGSKRVYKCNKNGCSQNGNNVPIVDNAVDNRIPQTTDDSIICQNQFCKDFINKLKSEVSFSKYSIETTCVNSKCEDVITVQYRDNSKDVYVCNKDGCEIKGASTTKPSRPAVTQSSVPCITSPCKEYYNKVVVYGKYTTLDVVNRSINGKRTDILTVVFSDGERRVYSCDDTKCTRTDLPAKTTTKKPTTTTKKPRTTTAKPRGPCLTSPCQEFYDKVVAYKKYTTLDVKTICPGGNAPCRDRMIVVFSDGERRVLDCDNTGCTQIAESTTTTITTRKPTTTTTPTVKPRGPCRTSPCQEFYDKVIAYGKYTTLNVQLQCPGGNAPCKDLMIVVFSDGERRVLECDNKVCKRVAERTTTTTTTTTTTKRPTTNTTTTAKPRGPCRTSPCQEYYEKVIGYGKYTMLNVQLSCKTSICKDLLTVVFSDGERRVYECDSKACNKIVEETTTSTTTTTTTSTTTTRRPPKITTTKAPTTVGVRACVEDSDCEGHHICFNGCIDPCSFCGKNAVCDIIQKTTNCRCPEGMQGDPNTECIPQPGGDTNLFPIKSTGCKLPNTVETMSFCPSRCTKGCKGPGSACHLEPGTITQLETVRVQCAPNYGIEDERRSLVPCYNGNWLEVFPKCLALCPALKSDTVVIQCWRDEREVSCLESMKPGTKATFRCRPSHSQYDYLKVVYATGIVCTADGKWNRPPPECKPDCGVPVSLKEIPQNGWFDNKINNGEDAELGMYPWHAGLYKYDSPGEKWEYFCGGSLVTARVVVTAAHCIATMIPNEIQVAMGKVFRSFDREEQTAESRSVMKIEFPREFNTGLSYTWDVGLLLLNKGVQISRFVMPVCHNARYTLDTIYQSTAFVAGWGSTHKDDHSEILQHTNFSIIDMAVCRRQVPSTLTGYDRFCGSKKGATVSIAGKGDSGGGVTSVFDNKHFIVGIVSINYQSVSIFINVTYDYIEDWMNKELFKFEIQEQFSTKIG